MKASSFTKKYLSNVPFAEEAKHHLSVIDQNFDADFSTSGRGYFSYEDQEKIQEQACRLLKEKLAEQATPILGDVLREAWAEVVADFHRQEFWGFQVQKYKSKKPLTEEQKTFRELGTYIGVLIGSMLILKTAFIYFGMHASSNPTDENIVSFVVTLILFLSILGVFLWRKTRR